MTKKVKLSDAAKDLKLQAQELITLMENYDGVKRKNGSSLNESEMNYIIEHYSQENQVENFDEYFQSKDKPVEAEEAPEEKPAKKPVKAKQNKKTDSAKKTDNKKNVRDEDDKKSKPVNSPAEEKAFEPKAEQKKTAEPEQAKSEPVQNKKQKQAAKPQKHGEKQKLGTSMSNAVPSATVSDNRRTVDTRGSYVNLDKYNERYEQIAPANKHKDNYSKKQKIKIGRAHV